MVKFFTFVWELITGLISLVTGVFSFFGSLFSSLTYVPAPILALMGSIVAILVIKFIVGRGKQ